MAVLTRETLEADNVIDLNELADGIVNELSQEDGFEPFEAVDVSGINRLEAFANGLRNRRLPRQLGIMTVHRVMPAYNQQL